MEQIGIVHDAWTLLESELAEQEYELIEVEYILVNGAMTLRLFIDREAGVNVDDCAGASRLVSAILDLSDFNNVEYILEVSSPGIERPIRKPKDFLRFIGETVKIKTVTPIEGRRRYKGTLNGFDDGLIGIEVDGEVHKIHIENVMKAKLDR